MPVATSSLRYLLTATCLVATLPAVAADRFTGSAYARGTDTLLYREVHLDDGNRQAIVFQCPDGKAFARKRIQVTAIASQPDFQFVDARSGYEEGVREQAGKRVAYVHKPGGELKESPLTVARDAVIDTGFDAWIRGHWADVVRDGSSAPFLMTSRLRFFPVKVASSDARSGERRFDLRLDAWYGFAAPVISVTYTEATHTLRRYEGPATIRDGRGKGLDVRIEFLPSDRERNVDGGAYDTLFALPLDGRCGN